MDKYLYLIIIYTINKYIALYGQYENINEKPLYDIFHNYLQLIDNKYVYILPIVILIYFNIRWYGSDILTSFLQIATILLLIKLITSNITTVPPTLEIYKYYGKDYMFSEHIALLTLITTLTFINSQYNIEKYSLLIFTVIEAYLLVASRIHYSVDIYIGTLLTFLLTIFINNIPIHII